MAKAPQVLELNPNTELTFKGPFTEYVTSNLCLTNPTSRSVFFKVKTTAPRFYCVRPNSGIVKPNETAVINVMLQPVDQTATLENERSRHKFMIQTAYSSDDDTPVDTFWKSVEPSQVMDSKLRVLFLHASGEPIDSPQGVGGAPIPNRDNSTIIQETNNSFTTSYNKTPVNKDSSADVAFNPTSGGDGGALRPQQQQQDQERLKKEIELRKMYQDEKVNLERENLVLTEKLEKLVQSAGTFQTEGYPTLHVILIIVFALLFGIIIGKLF